MNSCKICGIDFVPDAFHPRQKFCDVQCRKEARRQYKKAYNRVWQKYHPGYIREYRKKKKKV